MRTSRYYYTKILFFKILFICFVIMILPMKFVQALSIYDINEYSFKQFNSSNTCIKNEYNITGKLFYVKAYKDFYKIKTSDGIFILNNDSVKKYEIAKRDGTIKKRVLAKKHDLAKRYEIVEKSEQTKKYETVKGNKLFKNKSFKNKSLPCEVLEDLNGDIWFSITQYDEDSKVGSEDYMQHKLFKIDKNGKKICYSVIKNPPQVFYKDVFSKLKVDKNNNIWFVINKQDCIEENNEYKIGKVTQKGNISYYAFSNDIKKYIIASDYIWVLLYNDTVDVIDYEGKLINEYNIKGIKDITKDNKEDIWIIQNGSIKKFCDGEFVFKYSVDKSCNRLSVYNINRIAAFGYRKITIIENSKHRDIIVDSYINDNTFVYRNNNGGVVALNTEREYWNLSCEYRDDILAVTNIVNQNGNRISNKNRNGNRNDFQIQRINGGKYFPFYYASHCNGKIFVPCLNSIYLVKNNVLVKYVDLFKSSSSENIIENIKCIETDFDNNLYAITDRNLYIIDTDKNVKKINIWTLIKENDKKSDMKNNLKGNIKNDIKKDIKGDRIFVKILRDGEGRIYIDSMLENNHIIYSVEGENLKKLPNQTIQFENTMYYPINIFINYNDRIDLVYNIRGKYHVYDYDKHKIDNVFNHSSEQINKLFSTIKHVVKAHDGTIFALMDENNLYAKKLNDDDFKRIFAQIDNDYVTSIACDLEGKVYIGTYENGVYVYP
ncbi:hypothetical protein CLTEP_07230 [Clostridium tepidiprofundi DSM 19306]|uniref:Two component regulator propeller n=1 Tax=Clostridium tepidiprofundi DSM 19306 TaxID=1121338 RepID=A0A151B600_9CLOT|nr:hypothetical protein [Clostridium tepidiprofundi]KYH35319.1 hypothetical protein CLTEP_07230 [Clostridium tepidiprofundi DSM 19306]